MTRTRPLPTRPRPGFTLVELMVVILILGILVALLVPVIVGAVRRAREAVVATEETNLTNALAQFKQKYGEYPPSRIMLIEGADYNAPGGSIGGYPTTDNSPLASPASFVWYVPPATGVFAPHLASFSGNDITVGALATRSAQFLRKFFPRASLGATPWHDFNGNGVNDGPQTMFYLEGHECLVFFLGGIPSLNRSTGGTGVFGVNGFGKNPQAPFTNVNPLSASPLVYSENRYPPLYTFVAERLVDDDHDGFPGYADALEQPLAAHNLGDRGRYYAYFSNYGVNNGYDPNDVNLLDAGGNNTDGDLATTVAPFRVKFSTLCTAAADFRSTLSPMPNPYTSGPPVTLDTSTGQLNPSLLFNAQYQNAQTFQLISPGYDRQYGAGGEFVPGGNATKVPPYTFGGGTITYERLNEPDNITNFSGGRLD